jgi:hypothetical protein
MDGEFLDKVAADVVDAVTNPFVNVADRWVKKLQRAGRSTRKW